MKSWTKVVIAAAVAWYAAGASLTYGGIWDSRAHPTAGVDVEMTTGTTVTGDLSRDWSGDWLLQTDQGAEYRLRDYRAMSFPPREAKDALATIYGRHWRASAPFTLVLVLFVAYIMALGRRDRQSKPGGYRGTAFADSRPARGDLRPDGEMKST